MANISYNQKGGTIRFDATDFLSGLSPQYSASVGAGTANYFNGKLMAASAFNPYRALGYAAPGCQPTDVTNVASVTGMIRNFTLGSESSVDYAYGVENDALLQRLVISTKTLSSGGGWPHTTAGTGTITGNDIITYNCNIGGTSRACVFYSFNDSGAAWNVGNFNTSSGAFDDDWMSTIPAGALSPSGNNKPHPFIVGADDILYMGDGNILSALDGATGANGTFTATALTLPAGYVISSFAKLPDYLVIFAYYSSSGPAVAPPVTTSSFATAFLWNYLDLDPTYVIPLQDNVVTAGFEFGGTVGCFTQGAKPVQEGENRFCTIQIMNGLNFETKELFIGNPPIHGGVEVVDDSVQWNTDGVVHCWGTPMLDTPAGLNKLSAGTGTTSGALRTFGGLLGFQVMSSGSGTSGGAQSFALGTYSTGNLQTGSAAPNLPIGTVARVKRVAIQYGKTSSGGRALALSLYKEGGTEIPVVSALTAITTTNINTFVDRRVDGTEFGPFSELSLALTWSTGSGSADSPVVRAVEVDFEAVSITGNTP